MPQLKRFLITLFLLAPLARAETADYEVPTEGHPELKAYSHYAILDLSVAANSAGATELKYSVPATLTGRDDSQVSFVVKSQPTNTANPIHLSGDKGSGDCHLEDAQTSLCTIRYTHLVIDSAGVEPALRAQNLSPSEFQARVKVANMFSDGPIGILRYPLDVTLPRRR